MSVAARIAAGLSWLALGFAAWIFLFAGLLVGDYTLALAASLAWFGSALMLLRGIR